MGEARTVDSLTTNQAGGTRMIGASMSSTVDQAVGGVYEDGQVRLDMAMDWPAGTPVLVTPAVPVGAPVEPNGHVIVVGFGLAGRCVADLLDQHKLSYTIVERNPVTVETQRALGRQILQGDATDGETLVAAGLNDASMLALTIPDEDAVLKAVTVARRLRPKIYIIARTNFSSQGMRASQLGADDVIKAEQAVALQFHEKLSRRIRRPRTGGQR